MKKWIVGGIAALLLLACGWYVASPSITLSAMRSAAEAGSTDELAEYIDFPSLRGSLKEELKALLASEVTKEEGNPFAALGVMIGMSMVDRAVDAMVTPASMRRIFSAKKDGPENKISAVDASKKTIEIRRDGLDQFALIDPNATTKGGEIIFKRHGLSWKLSELRLPAIPEDAGPLFGPEKLPKEVK